MNRQVKSVLALLVVLVALWFAPFSLLTNAGLAAEGSDSAIGFEQDGPLAVVWDEPLAFVVLNNTTLDLQVNLFVEGFVLTQQPTSLSEPLNLMQMPEAVFTLPATARKPIILNFNPQAQPGPGIYSGWITLSTGQPATVIRKEVRLSVPIPQVEGLKSEQTTFGSVPPAVDAWTLQAYRFFPGMRPFCFRNLSFACTLPVKVQNPPAVAKAGFIGTLHGDQDGGMTVAFTKPQRNHAILDLAFTRVWPSVGTYNGVLDFLPSNDGGEVALTVNIKDTFIVPVAVVGLGILLAQWAQWYITVRRGVMEVERRLAQVTVDFETVPNEVINGYTIKTDVAVQSDAIAKALEDWSAKRIFKPDEEDAARYKSTIMEPLEKLEHGVQAWSSFDTLLQKLRTTLDTQAWPVIQKAKPPAHLNLDTPRFYIVAQALLRGRPISLRDFTQRQQVIKQAIALATLWGELEQLRAAVAEALDFVSQYKFQLSTTAQQDLELARRKLSEVHREMWEAGNLTRLRILRTTDDLDDAKAILNQLMGLIEIGPPEAAALAPEGVEMVGPWSAEGGTFLGSFEMSVLRNLRARLWGMVPPSLKRGPEDDLETARKRVAWLDHALLAGDAALVGLAFLTAVIAGLKPYFTSNFGSLYNYLSAFTWGFGAKAAVEVVNALIEKFFGD